MRHRGHVLVPALVGLFAAGALGCAEDSGPTTEYELSGYVHQSPASGSGPLEGVTVTFVSDTLYSASATTDGDGYYEMIVASDVPFGQVHAQLAGYQPAETTVYFDAPTRRIDLLLRPE